LDGIEVHYHSRHGRAPKKNKHSSKTTGKRKRSTPKKTKIYRIVFGKGARLSLDSSRVHSKWAVSGGKESPQQNLEIEGRPTGKRVSSIEGRTNPGGSMGVEDTRRKVLFIKRGGIGTSK